VKEELRKKMPMKAVYDVLDGEVLGETRGGAGRTYLPDPLGSTAALIDSSQNITDEWEYWPYGEVRSHAGTSTTPFTYLGTLGYYSDGDGRYYVRARALDARDARWTTVDPLWPREKAYCYAGGLPTSAVDPSGAGPGIAKCKRFGKTPRCFFCAYHSFRNAGSGAQASCKAANRSCGTHMPCGPCGPFPVPDFGPVPCINFSLNEYLRHECGNTGLPGDPGGGDDKLAHCYAACQATHCFGGAGFVVWEIIRRDEEGDQMAERVGSACACAGRGRCLSCCADVTEGWPRDDWI
jgi:RHS repeat-associated protein